jgi:outer membrane receptor protein involved in Fe transport
MLAAIHLNAGERGVHVTGIVRDESGAVVPKAAVTLRSGPFQERQTADRAGRFEFDAVPGRRGSIRVEAEGFSPLEQAWEARQGQSVSLAITLHPAPLAQNLVVTATRTPLRLGETPASVLALSSQDLSTTPALAIDDMLRQVPGFSLFRRQGSRTANPTAQGVSLRGVGASGASRALVLADGIPLNDPFGGWVYWDRVPRASLKDVEVVQGGASDLYGTGALGGVVNLRTWRPADSILSLETSYGNEQIPDVSLSAGTRWGKWGGQVDAEAFKTDGYIPVDKAERGRVDTAADSSHTVATLMLERSLTEHARVFLRGSLFGEARTNGTPLERNRTHLRQLAFGGDWQSAQGGVFALRIYGGSQVFDQTFAAVATDRNSEVLTRSQRVPAHQIGASGQWSRLLGNRQTLVAGVEASEVRGASDEIGFAQNIATSAVGAGGRARTMGVFGEDLVRFGTRWLLTGGVRVDRWRNYAALCVTRPLSPPGPASVSDFPDRTETALSPRLSLLYRLSDHLSLTASGYRAFRAPTLNELYRSFRVGNVVTQSNDALRAERLTGGEVGARFGAFGDRLSLRGVFFDSAIARPIANLTLSVTPVLITRQRQNLGRIESRGVEFDADARLTSRLDVSGGYQFVDARVGDFAPLAGLLVPHVPRHTFTFQTRYAAPARFTLAFQGRYGGAEFDDDLNVFRLNPYFTLNALLSRALGHGVEIFAASENLFDQRYTVARVPLRQIGPPILFRAGMRMHLGMH